MRQRDPETVLTAPDGSTRYLASTLEELASRRHIRDHGSRLGRTLLPAGPLPISHQTTTEGATR